MATKYTPEEQAVYDKAIKNYKDFKSPLTPNEQKIHAGMQVRKFQKKNGTLSGNPYPGDPPSNKTSGKSKDTHKVYTYPSKKK